MNRLSLLLFLLLLPSVGLNVYLLSDKLNQSTLFKQTQTIAQQLENNRTNQQSNDETASVATQTITLTSDTTNNNEITSDQMLADLTVNQLIELAQQQFDRQEFDQAVNTYEELSLKDEFQAQQLYQIWLEQLKDWTNTENYSPLDRFIESFILRFPYNAPVLTVKANSMAMRELPQQAIQLFQELFSYTYEQTQKEYYQARIRHIANEHIAVLIENLAWQQLIDFAESLLQQDPDYPPHVLAYSLALIELDSLDNAEAQLQPILQISYYQQQAQQLINKINKLRLHQTAIRLQPVGDHYLVTGQMNRTAPVTLMIDTGASISVITRNLFEQLSTWADPIFERETIFNTAGGQVTASIYRFDSFQIEDFLVEDVAFAVMDLDNMRSYDGLLGMNFLKQFVFQIDQQEHLLILSPK